MCGGKLVSFAVLGVAVATFFAVLFSDDENDVFALGLGMVPTTWLMKVGAFVMWASTAKVIPALGKLGIIEIEDCFEEDVSSTVKVLVAAPKGGALFSGFLIKKLTLNCGISATMGTPVEDNWKDPPPDVLPDHEADFLLGIGFSANNWGEYLEKPFNANKKLQCVVMTRNPFERFLSLYKYTRDAGESGLRLYSKELKKINDFEGRVKYAWNTFGEMMMTKTHALLTRSMEMNCTQIKADDLFFVSSEKYDELVERILKVYGVKDEVLPSLMKIFQQNDINRMTEEQKAANRHISGKSLEAGEKKAVRKIIRNDPEISRLLSKQCHELNFDC